MTTSSINHRPATFVAVAATGVVGALFALRPDTAIAIPAPDAPRAVAGRTAPTNNPYVEHPCFTRPLSWNVALDGPLPRCHTYVH